MYGWTEGEALAMNFREILLESERDRALADVRQQCKAGVLEPLRQQRIAKDGRTLRVSLIVSALVNGSGDTYAIATTEREVEEGSEEKSTS
jgi:two-component system CheB/CheR fusion protein